MYLSPGTVLASRYEIEDEIGRGGSSIVYAATDRQLDLRVAIKLLVPPPASAHATRERMRREVGVVRELSHESIVRVYDFVDDGERSFLVMQLINGGDVAGAVAAHRPIAVDPHERFPTAVSMQQALAAGHANGSSLLSSTLTVTQCVVCGIPEPFGGLVCRFCVGNGGSAADTLLVVAGDERPMARVPSAMSEVALARLRVQGHEANAVPVRLAWTAIPRATWLLAALVAIAGVGAASVGVGAGYWPTAVVLTGLLISAERTIRRPVFAKSPPRWLSETNHDRMLTTLSALSQGEARSLFSVLTARVRAFSRLAERHAELGVLSAGVEELYAASCQAALDLDDTDRAPRRDVPEELQPYDETGGRSRGLLTNAMLTAIAQVERICALAIDGAQEVQIVALAEELARQVDALQAVEGLLLV